ncbi:uncharacterized protein [Chelonus insularis]|uniref:uncharacterized protein n=1 Tax=Chelonus insularis TaxID=460826 RepID=UPI00158DF219|nr:uncharacterized protein LOC118069120 [Chelonus insularis]
MSALLEKIRNGLKSMKSYLDRVKGIASLVSNTFKRKNDQKPCDDDKNGDGMKRPESSTLASAFFRLLGLDTPKIAAITVNSAIFLAQMVSLLFGINSQTKRSSDQNNSKEKTLFDPFKFFMESDNEDIQDLVRQAQSSELPNRIIDGIDEFDAACVRLLMCKFAPIILHAQESLKNKTATRFAWTTWIPTKSIFEENAEYCEIKHSDCKIFPEEILDD